MNDKPIEVGFHYGALCDPLEQQANEQGFTLGSDADLLEELKHCILMCWIQGVCTDSQKDSMLQKLHKKVIGALKKDGVE